MTEKLRKLTALVSGLKFGVAADELTLDKNCRNGVVIVSLFDFTEELGVFRLVDVELIKGNLEFVEEVLGTDAEGASSSGEENSSVLGDDLLERHCYYYCFFV